jgi:hypothetical protein
LCREISNEDGRLDVRFSDGIHPVAVMVCWSLVVYVCCLPSDPIECFRKNPIRDFVDFHCAVFDTEDENKFSYTEIHDVRPDLGQVVVGLGLTCGWGVCVEVSSSGGRVAGETSGRVWDSIGGVCASVRCRYPQQRCQRDGPVSVGDG